MSTRTERAVSKLAIESWPVEKVIPYARTARRIPETAIAKVAPSIAEFGWRTLEGDGRSLLEVEEERRA